MNRCLLLAEIDGFFFQIKYNPKLDNVHEMRILKRGDKSGCEYRVKSFIVTQLR